MKTGMNAEYDFKAAGYEGPGDWSRLHDLIPAREELTKDQRGSLEADDSKRNVMALLTIHGVKFGARYDGEAAGVRNA